MAKVITKHNKNTDKTLLCFVGVLLCLAAPFGVFAAANMLPTAYRIGAAALTALAAVLIAMHLSKTIGVLKSGLAGERAVAKLLTSLPEDCTVVANPVYVVDGKTMELDAVVVSKNGVFIVETKNHAGDIEGSTKAQNWRQTRLAKGGVPFTKEMKNPLLQLERQQRLLSKMLGVPVEGCVYFANRYAKVHVDSERICTTSAALLRAAKKGGGKLSADEQKQIVRLLRQ